MTSYLIFFTLHPIISFLLPCLFILTFLQFDILFNESQTVAKVSTILDHDAQDNKNIKIHPLGTAKMGIMLLACFIHSQRPKFKVKKVIWSWHMYRTANSKLRQMVNDSVSKFFYCIITKKVYPVEQKFLAFTSRIA